MNKQPQAVKNKHGKTNAAKAKVSAARLACLQALKQVFSGQSLSVAQTRTIDLLEDGRDRGLANELVNGVLRWRWQLEYFVSQLMPKPLKAKDNDVQLILLMAMYELKECRTPDYAIINESVELVRKSGRKWAAGLVNAVLRRYTREQEKLIASIKQDQVKYSHPAWLLEKIKKDWPADGAAHGVEQDTVESPRGWRQIVDANNQRPAFWLRINPANYSVEQYKKMLTDAAVAFNDETVFSGSLDQALKLEQGIDVRTLPGFADGAVSVQDAGAQLAAELLTVSGKQRVLDLCAAPGGKTCHLLERYPAVEKLVAVEFDEHRMQRVTENLQRLKLEHRVELVVADARDYKQWWQGEQFDSILIDAPCSASGVIRRHPDIKTLRRESDIEPLVKLQSEILSAAWQMLADGGELLYVTCSIFKDENQNQIENFLSLHKNASEIKITADWGELCEYGRQLFPGEQDADGFYFCRLKKSG